jgi:hypothetical protein|nr:MAG TPA: hypothetical protein [Caudoviricetes sp.]
MFKLQRLNEIKYVKEEKDKAKLIAKGFKEIKEPEKKEKSKRGSK